MEEFLSLYLTGKRAEDFRRFNRFTSAVGLFGGLLALIPVLLHLFGIGDPPLNISLCAVGLLFEIAASVLSLLKRRYSDGLVEIEHSTTLHAGSDREREIAEKLYDAWRETYGRRDVRLILSMGIAALGYLTLVLSVILVTCLPLPGYFLPIACIVSAAILMIPVVIRTSLEGSARARLYGRAGREIDEMKRTKLSRSEARICREAEYAQGFSLLPVSVAMFLKEDVEREEFRSLSKRSGIVSFIIGFLFALIVILTPVFLSGVLERIGTTLSWTLVGLLFAAVLCILLALLIPIEGRKREIYRRNAEKLGENEADNVRMQLQSAWIRLQRGGNRMFLCFLIGSVVLGLVLGLIGYFTGMGENLAESIGSSVMCFLIPAAILSVVIWCIVFAVYRKRVRPLELRLKAIGREKEEEE